MSNRTSDVEIEIVKEQRRPARRGNNGDESPNSIERELIRYADDPVAGAAAAAAAAVASVRPDRLPLTRQPNGHDDPDEDVNDIEEYDTDSSLLPFPIPCAPFLNRTDHHLPHPLTTTTTTSSNKNANETDAEAATSPKSPATTNSRWLQARKKLTTAISYNRSGSTSSSKKNSTHSGGGGGGAASSAWSSIFKAIRSAQTNTSLFLGMDATSPTSSAAAAAAAAAGISTNGSTATAVAPSTSSAAHPRMLLHSGSRGSRDNASQQQRQQHDTGDGAPDTPQMGDEMNASSNAIGGGGLDPITAHKTINNWNQRTFLVLKKNRIFGGKLKQSALDDYVHNLDENVVEETNPFIMYKRAEAEGVDLRTRGADFDLARQPSVARLAVNGVKKVIIKRAKSQTDQQQQQQQVGPRKVPTRQLQFASVARERNVAANMYDEPDRLRAKSQVYTNGPEASNEDNVEGPWDAFTGAFADGRRLFGVGFCGRLCDNDLDPAKKDKYAHIIDSVTKHRPYFTYWVTFVQTVICLVSLFTYGLAPIGFSYTLQRGMATTINLEKQLISFPVKENFWIGPATMDLVHMGAKYAPCMRNDSNIYRAIELDKARERQSACCIRNDRGGCVQTSKDQCSQLLSHFHKWNASSSSSSSSSDSAVSSVQRRRSLKRNSGSVCGLDPDDADAERWPDDITRWPVCEKPTSIVNSSVEKNQHMYCEIIGRPCCIGIQGECIVSTLEHCDLMRGYFHANAHLCAQVDCMQDVCGMIDFLNPESPDQVYRLFTSIFIHAGIVQLLFTIFFQMFILSDVENLAGFLRVAIIYTASGVIGNLGSAIFLPYQAEVGPLGSQFGIIACLFVEHFEAWELYENPYQVLLKLVATLSVLIAVGFLPMIDNFANVFGFLAGLLLGSILFPNINMKGHCKRALIISVAISITVVVIGALVVMFYIKPIDKCDWCKLFSCPFGSKYCLDMDFNITRLN